MDYDYSPQLQSPDSGIGGVVITVLQIIGLWMVFRKAGYPGWYAIIPIFNIYIVLKVAGKSGWWLILLIIPIVNIIAWLFVAIALGDAFGRSGVFSFFLLFLLSPIGLLLLGFGGYRYTNPDYA